MHLAPRLHDHLERVCRRDPEHPRARVHTVYFDDLGLTSLGEKLNSDYLKSKVRLRWYEDLESGELSNVFAEVKWRVGARRRKSRRDTGVSGTRLAVVELTDPELARIAGGELAATGRPAATFPVLASSYRRDRFTDRQTGARISLDWEIRLRRTHPRFLTRRRPGALSLAVAEFKSPDGSLPPSLRLLTAFGARRQSFSKYQACHAAAA